MTLVHPDYSILAARVAVSNLHKETSDSFLEVAKKLYNFTDVVGKSLSLKNCPYTSSPLGRPAPLLAKDVYEIIEKNHERI